MSNLRDLDFLADILEAVDRTSAYISQADYTESTNDTKTQDAVIRNIEIIGEATKRLSSEVRTAHPNIPWKIWQACAINLSITILGST